MASSSASGSGSGQGAGDEEDGGGEGGRRNAEEWRIVGRCVGAVGAMAVGRHAGVLVVVSSSSSGLEVEGRPRRAGVMLWLLQALPSCLPVFSLMRPARPS